MPLGQLKKPNRHPDIGQLPNKLAEDLRDVIVIVAKQLVLDHGTPRSDPANDVRQRECCGASQDRCSPTDVGRLVNE